MLPGYRSPASYLRFVPLAVSLLFLAFLMFQSEQRKQDTDFLKIVKSNDLKAVEALIKSGRDPNTRDTAGRTVLMEAARYSTPEMVSFLIQHGANVNDRNDYGETALMVTRNTEIARILIAHGVDVNARAKVGDTPLLMAAGYGGKGQVELLLDHGAKVNEADTDGMTPLMMAKDVTIANLLLVQGADVRAITKDGWTCLMYARYDADLLKLLLAHGTDINARNNTGTTVLGLVLQEKNVSTEQMAPIEKLLRKAGAQE